VRKKRLNELGVDAIQEEERDAHVLEIVEEDGGEGAFRSLTPPRAQRVNTTG